MIGRAAQKQPIAAFHVLEGRKTPWSVVGWLGVIGGFLILSYYIVVAGWAIDFTLKSVVNITSNIKASADADAKAYRATEPMAEMRKYLAEDLAAKASKAPAAALRAQIRVAAVWRDHDILQAALASSDNPDEVRRRLLEDDVFRAHIEQAEPVVAELAALDARHKAQAERDVSAMADKEVRDQAETLKRRERIAGEIGSRFGRLFGDGWTCTFWAAIFMLITILIVSGGISGGIERACRFLMPTLIVLILVMVGYGTLQPGFGEAVSFVFKPDPSKLHPSGWLEALGHAFFTLSLGMGAMITYGSYQQSKEGLAGESVAICIFDTGIAILACMMMFPILFSYGQEAGAGPGLVFVSMPLAFAEIGSGGMLLATLFFGLLVFAALTSAISLLEVVSSYFIDGLGWGRKRAAWTLGGAIFIFSLPSAFSGSESFLLSSWEPTFGKNFFDTIDYLASNWMLPLGGLLISVYAGWVMPKKFRDAELVGLAPALVGGWLFLVRFLAPILVLIVLGQKVGLIDADALFA